jgi:hypothetical protein
MPRCADRGSVFLFRLGVDVVGIAKVLKNLFGYGCDKALD